MVESTSRAAQLEALEQRKKRNEIGRYTIQEAAELAHTHIEPQTQTISSLEESLENLVEEKQVRNVSSYREPYLFLSFPGPLKGNNEPEIIVQWDDLNEVWLPSLNIKWQFPNPFKKVDVFESDNQSTQDSNKILVKADWVFLAEKIGKEIVRSQKSSTTKLTKRMVAKKIEEYFKQQGLKGTKGFLKSSAIERELTWWPNRYK